VATLSDALKSATPLVKEHIEWALEQQTHKRQQQLRKTARLIRIVEKGLPRDA
jgi:hypothetical protein